MSWEDVSIFLLFWRFKLKFKLFHNFCKSPEAVCDKFLLWQLEQGTFEGHSLQLEFREGNKKNYVTAFITNENARVVNMFSRNRLSFNGFLGEETWKIRLLKEFKKIGISTDITILLTKRIFIRRKCCYSRNSSFWPFFKQVLVFPPMIPHLRHQFCGPWPLFNVFMTKSPICSKCFEKARLQTITWYSLFLLSNPIL